MSAKITWFARAVCAAVVCVCLVAPAAAATTDTTDVWDISQGNVVTGFWPSGLYEGSDVRNMFGGEFGTIEPGNTIFPDAGWLPGASFWVTWATPAVVELNRFVLSVGADGNYPESYNRAIRGFKLYASIDGSTWGEPVYDSGPLTAPLGAPSGGMYYYIADQTLATPVSSRHFKMEFICDTTTGPRIIELDGYVPEPATLSLLAAAGLALIRRRK